MSLSTWNSHSPCVWSFLNRPQGVCGIQMELPNPDLQENLWFDCLWRESSFFFGFNVTGHCLVHVRMLHYLRVDSCITITQSHTHTMQQTRTRQWPGALKPKRYSLVEDNQSIISFHYKATSNNCINLNLWDDIEFWVLLFCINYAHLCLFR